MDAAEALAARARECVRTRQPLEVLQAIAQEAAGLPVYAQELESVGMLVGRAQAWLKKANEATAQVCGVRACVVCMC